MSSDDYPDAWKPPEDRRGEERPMRRWSSTASGSRFPLTVTPVESLYPADWASPRPEPTVVDGVVPEPTEGDD